MTDQSTHPVPKPPPTLRKRVWIIALIIILIVAASCAYFFKPPPHIPEIKITRLVYLSQPFTYGNQFPLTLSQYVQKHGQEIPVPNPGSPAYLELKASLQYATSSPSHYSIPYDPTLSWIISIQEDGQEREVWVDCRPRTDGRGVTYLRENHVLNHPFFSARKLCPCLDQYQPSNTPSPASTP